MAILINDASATGPLEQGINYNISSDGPYWVRTWIGASSQIAALVDLASLNAESVQFNNEAPKATLIARYARHPLTGAESVQSKIEIKTEVIPQNVWLAPAYIGLPQSVIKTVVRVFENNTVYTDAVAEIAASAVSDHDFSLAQELYNLMIMGELHFESFTSSLTFTRIVSRYYSIRTSREELGKVFSTDQVAAYIGDPILFDVPSLTVTADETAKFLVAGWRKRLADVNAVAGGSRTIVENWTLAKWNSKVYTFAF